DRNVTGVQTCALPISTSSLAQGVPVPDVTYMLLALLTAGGITWALRALPFAVLEPMRDSEWLDYLGKRMPLGIMVILTVYTLDDVELTVAASAGPAFLALAVTVVLHVWRGNAVLSLFAGTGIYALLASIIAAG